MRFRADKGPKAGAPVVHFREPGPPGSGPKYAHASKEWGAAERKKNQERKSQESGKRYKRDLNTQAARGPANLVRVTLVLIL